MRRPIVLVPLILVGLVVVLFGGIYLDESLNGSLFDDSDNAPNNGPCLPSDFHVEKVSVSVADGYAHLTGNVVSRCARDSGIELKWTTTRDDGTVVFSHTFWPASISNIPARSTHAFEFDWVAPSGHFSSKVEPFKTQAW